MANKHIKGIGPVEGLKSFLSEEQIEQLKQMDLGEIKDHFEKLERQQLHGCTCRDCEKKLANLEKHLDHAFYKDAHNYREQERRGQIVKGSEKYDEPFNPASWTAKELLQHAMQENVDQGHYIYGLYSKIEEMDRTVEEYKNALRFAHDEAKYWRLRCADESKKG